MEKGSWWRCFYRTTNSWINLPSIDFPPSNSNKNHRKTLQVRILQCFSFIFEVRKGSGENNYLKDNAAGGRVADGGKFHEDFGMFRLGQCFANRMSRHFGVLRNVFKAPRCFLNNHQDFSSQLQRTKATQFRDKSSLNLIMAKSVVILKSLRNTGLGGIHKWRQVSFEIF